MVSIYSAYFVLQEPLKFDSMGKRSITLPRKESVIMEDEQKVVTPAATTSNQNQTPAAATNSGFAKKHKKNK